LEYLQGVISMFYTKTIGSEGYANSGASPSTDISTGTKSKIKVNLNIQGDVVATIAILGCTTGALIASALQTSINAALIDNGKTGSVTCEFVGGVYVITPADRTIATTIVISDADADNCANLLKLGVANGGIETTGLSATSTSDTAPQEQLALKTDTTLKLALDGQAAVDVVLANSGKTTGALIAADIQAKANAALIAGSKTGSITCTFTGGVYVLTSAKLGTVSAVVITDGTANNVADDLKLGAANGGTAAIGTRFCKVCDVTDENIMVMCAGAKELYFYKDIAKTKKLFMHVAGITATTYTQIREIQGSLYCEALENDVVVAVNLW
jgi:hypothetical protein